MLVPKMSAVDEWLAEQGLAVAGVVDSHYMPKKGKYN